MRKHCSNTALPTDANPAEERAEVTTAYHSTYWAHALTLKGPSDSIDSLSRSISGARVDLNPHQIDAALFALRSPLSQGVILADEVGLGKTIEAGLVLSQRWAERRRKILVIVPATLRKQWQQELDEKFFLPGIVLESGNFNQLRAGGYPNPFDQESQLVICSYHFASAKAEEIKRVQWDTVVVDEAHRMRNVYRSSSKMARTIDDAIRHAPKLLLTATPLQNSLMELYGLVSVIDPHVFGNEVSFREQFVRSSSEKRRNAQLRERLVPVATRTLRKQVLEYIRFTKRIPLTQEFLPSEAEQRLYAEVSAYLQRDELIALPASQRALMTMVLRKLLASSSFAIGATLHKLIRRLETLEPLEPDLEDEFETLVELQDEWDADLSNPAPDVDQALLREELAELRRFATLADSIEYNAKGDALIEVLDTAFERATGLGAARKAVIFTESRRTQQYLFDRLTEAGFAGSIVTLSGTNNDPASRAIYEEWRQRHPGSGSRAVDIKAAIIEDFRERATIMIATEAAAEGVNLQFCSLVVNYDLPWNPQRIEQRIGRCHRYGQQHDVVVVNFLNRGNAADRRVFELLSEKFRLFDGVFGASDEVLGALESGVDLEQRIARVYQTCRTPAEIEAAFDKLQSELEEQIQDKLAETRQVILDHFDETIHQRLEVHRDQALASLDQRAIWLLELTRHELAGRAVFEEQTPRFRYDGPLGQPGTYHLDWKAAEANGDIFYRAEDELAGAIIERAIARDLPTAELRFDYRAHGAIVSALEPLIGSSGWLELSKLTVESLDTEEFLLLTAFTDDGVTLDQEQATRLMSLPASAGTSTLDPPVDRIAAARKSEIRAHLKRVDERNVRYVDEEAAKLERWSDDLKLGLLRELDELEREFKQTRREASIGSSLSDKLEVQRRLRDIERRKNRKRQELFAAQDQIDQDRDELITRIEQQLKQQHDTRQLFTVRWTLN